MSSLSSQGSCNYISKTKQPPPSACGEKPVVYNKNRYELNWDMSGLALLSKGNEAPIVYTVP